MENHRVVFHLDEGHPDAFLKGVQIVSSGVGELVKKQALGWAWIRP